MKQPKRLTRKQKEILVKNKLGPDNWMLVEDTGDYIKVMNKQTWRIIEIQKRKEG